MISPGLIGTANRDPHIAFVVDSGAFGGAHVYLRYLLHMLSPTITRSLIVSEPVADYFEDSYYYCQNVIIVPLSEGQSRSPGIAKALASVPADLNFVNLIHPRLTRAALDAAVETRPSIGTLHLTDTTGDGGERAALARLYLGLKHVIAVSAPIEQQLRADFGIPGDRITRIRNGVALPVAATKRPAAFPLRIGVVARLTRQKGLDVLLEGLSRLLRRRQDFSVLIAGAGEQRADLERSARRLPVTFLGHINDVPKLLDSLDVFCLPSRDEGLPLALLEAMGHGLPCIATLVGDNRDAAADDAILVEPNDPAALADALDCMLSDPAKRRELGARARERAIRDFTVQRMVEETEDLVRQVAAGLY